MDGVEFLVEVGFEELDFPCGVADDEDFAGVREFDDGWGAADLFDRGEVVVEKVPDVDALAGVEGEHGLFVDGEA